MAGSTQGWEGAGPDWPRTFGGSWALCAHLRASASRVTVLGRPSAHLQSLCTGLHPPGKLGYSKQSGDTTLW